MRKLSKAAKAAMYDALEAKVGLLDRAVHLLARGELPDGRQIVTEEGCTYTYRLYGAARAHGGIVLCTFACPGQNDHIDVSRLDDLLQRRNFDFEHRAAIDRLAAARRIALDAEGAS